jgi:hypothetical protein
MAQQGTHKNSITGERLARNIQVCNMCFRNFASDRAWEKHYVREKFPNPSYCLKPEEAGLKEFRNTFGSIIYR